MSMNLYHAGNGDGLFNILGKYFHYLDTLNTARKTTVPTEALDAVNQFKKKTDGTLDLDRNVNRLAGADLEWRTTGDFAAAAAIADCQELLMQFVQDDSLDVNRTLAESVQYVIDQMITDNDYVDENVLATPAVAAGGGNSTNDLIIKTNKFLGNGDQAQNLLAEVVTFEVTDISDPLAPTLSVRSELATELEVSEEWPKGSGIDSSITADNIDTSLLSNGGFEEAAIANTPDDWQVQNGVPGTGVVLSTTEVQTVAIAGSPTAGSYLLRYNDGSTTRSTVTLAHNASASAVQAALRALPGLELVTVSSSGTSPNLTHTITFTGVAGNVNQLTAINNLDTGTVTPATTTAGTDAYRGKSLRFDANSEITQDITLEPETVYVIAMRAKKVGSATGNFVVSIKDSAGGSALTQAGTGTNLEAITLISSFSTSAWTDVHFFFSLPNTVQMPVTVSIAVNTLAVGQVLLDEVVLVEATQLYDGGPYVVVLAGADAPAIDDSWTITYYNDRAGSLQEWFQRAFDMRSLGLLLPTSGATTIPDSVIG